MIQALAVAILALHALVLALLLPFAGHRLAMLVLSRRPRPSAAGRRASPDDAPRITVQLPVYNERNVVERLIDAACRLDHPAARLQIQVLDDSTDETTALARVRARRWRRRGVDIAVLHRTDRAGYKAGALAEGMASATGDFILVLDADFVPAPSLLRDLLPEMADPDVGMVQARWDHLNARDSWLTRAQALILDAHFFVEQRGRCRGGRFFNFNGTAGLWRREALAGAGGWESDTLTEDLDISYRAQMAGWRFVLRDDVGAPAELPDTPRALLVQQRRWAQGGVQTARKILPRLLSGPWRPAIKAEAVAHLCGAGAYPLAAALAMLIVPSAMARVALGLERLWWIDLAVFLAATLPFAAFFWTAGRRRRRGGRAGEGERADSLAGDVVRAFVLGAALPLLLAPWALRGLRRTRDPFERTPKTGGRAAVRARAQVEGLAEPGPQPVRASDFPGRRLAFAAGLILPALGVLAAVAGQWGSLPYVALFSSGYLLLGRPPRRSAAQPAMRTHTGSQRTSRVHSGCSHTPVVR